MPQFAWHYKPNPTASCTQKECLYDSNTLSPAKSLLESREDYCWVKKSRYWWCLSFLKKQSTSPRSFHWHSIIFFDTMDCVTQKGSRHLTCYPWPLTFNRWFKVGISTIDIQRTNRQRRQNLWWLMTKQDLILYYDIL